MEIKVLRDTFTGNTTIGQLHINDIFQCYTLELKTPADGEQHIKGNCCVPLGKYQITLRAEGEVFEWMQKAESGLDLSAGLPHIYNCDGTDYPAWIDNNGILPDQFVLIHIGNYQKDTLGCLLVGLQKGVDQIMESTAAFAKIYPQIIAAFQSGESVTIEYVQA